MDLRQFKLTNEDEIICEVVEWNDDENDNLLVKRALKIHATDDFDGTMRYYTFKPWMMMNNDLDSLQVLSSYHIICESVPTKVAIQYYNEVVNDMVNTGDDTELLTFDSAAEKISFTSDENGGIIH